MARHRILGVSFDHMHMGDLLREVAEHPDAEIAGLFDPDRSRMASAIETFGVADERVFSDLDACLAASEADVAIVCSATADHADYIERLAPHGAAHFRRETVRGQRRRCAPDDGGHGGERAADGDQLADRLVPVPCDPPSGCSTKG